MLYVICQELGFCSLMSMVYKKKEPNRQQLRCTLGYGLFKLQPFTCFIRFY